MLVTLALAFSLSVGIVDILLSILPGPSGLYAFSTMLWPLLATFTAFFAAYLGCWYLVVDPLRRSLTLDALHSKVALGFFLGTLFILFNLTRFPLQPSNLVKYFILLVVSLLVASGSFFTAKVITKRTERGRRVGIFFLAAPLMIAEAMVFIWWHVYRAGPFFSPRSCVVLVGLLLTVILTLGWAYRVTRLAVMKRLIAALAVVVVLSPFVSILINRPGQDLAGRGSGSGGDHGIRQVILICIDTLRSDALSCYGPGGAGTPHIDDLAGDGVLFTNAVAAAPWTLPSMSSIMTGVSPSVHMATRPDTKLPKALPTLAEEMCDSGYRTAAIVSNAFLSPKFNFSQGFAEYQFYPKYSPGDSFGLHLLQALFADHFQSEVTTEELTDLTIEWLDSHYDQDFFLWVHYFDPHTPYTPPGRFVPEVDPPSTLGNSLMEELAMEIHLGTFVPTLVERAWIRALYQGEVSYVDANIGRLTDALKRLGIYDQALIVLTSDHGEEFWEHHRFEHGHSLYNEVIRVPLIFKLPGTSSKGSVSTIVPNQAIGPTILDLCGIDGEDLRQEVDSFASLWRQTRGSNGRRPIVSEGLYFFENRKSVIFRGYKYIEYQKTDREELYDLTRDPDEETSVLDVSPGLVREAKEILDTHEARAGVLRDRIGIKTGEVVEFDEETIQKLRSLGYI